MIKLDDSVQSYNRIFERGESIFANSKSLSKRIEILLGKKEKDEIDTIYINKLLEQVFSNSEFENTSLEGEILSAQKEEVIRFFAEVSKVLEAPKRKRKEVVNDLCQKWEVDFEDNKSDNERFEQLFNYGLVRLNSSLANTIEYIDTKEYILGQNLEFERFLSEYRKQLQIKKDVSRDFVDGIVKESGSYDKKTLECRQEAYETMFTLYNKLLDEVVQYVDEDEIVPKNVVTGCRQTAKETYMFEELQRFSSLADLKMQELKAAKEAKLEGKVLKLK